MTKLEEGLQEEFNLEIERRNLDLAGTVPFDADFLPQWAPAAEAFIHEQLTPLMAMRVRSRSEKRLIEKNVGILVRKISSKSDIFIPRSYPEFSGQHVLTMDRCPGQGMAKCVDVIANIADPALSWDQLTVGDMLALQNAAVLLHMYLDVIGWMLLDESSKIIHGDPHPGNAMCAFKANMAVVRDDAESHFVAEPSFFDGNEDEHPAEFKVAVGTIDLGGLIESVEIDQNTLSLLDWGSAIQDEEKLVNIRLAMKAIVRALCSSDDPAVFDGDPAVLEAINEMGFPSSFAGLLRMLLKGKASEDGTSVSGRMANRDADTTEMHAQQAMDRFQHDLLEHPLDKDNVTLVNVLVFAGGIAMEMDRVLAKLWEKAPEVQRKPVTVAGVWEHMVSAADAADA